jgi:carbon monoxide dehydrogenase subunit G
MASIVRDILIDAPPQDAWSALRDFASVHERLVPGFVVGADSDGDDTRIVTFFNGAVAREVLVGIDDTHQRLAYTVVESALGASHHNAAAQVCASDGGGTRFVWITDVLPDEVAPRVTEMMERGLDVIKHTLETAAR